MSKKYSKKEIELIVLNKKIHNIQKKDKDEQDKNDVNPKDEERNWNLIDEM